MNMTVTETRTSTTGPSAGDPGQMSDDMNKRFEYRKAKLLEYKALIDFLQQQGEDVTEMNRLHTAA